MTPSPAAVPTPLDAPAGAESHACRRPSGGAWLRSFLVLVAVTAVLGLAAGCSSGDPEVATAPPGTSGTTLAPGTTLGVAAKCDDALLLAAVQTKFAGATINDVVCRAGEAVLTLIGAAGIDGDGVGILVGTSGAWEVAASGAVDADPNGLLPEGFTLTLYNAWRDKYDARANPTPTVSRPKSPGTTKPPAVNDDDHPRCFKKDNRYVCTSPSTTTTTTAPTTTIPKPTTTPTTAPPPVTEPPTVPPPTTPVVSDFCKANPFNPNCLSNPGFPG